MYGYTNVKIASFTLQKRENILEFNETQAECRKQLSLGPSYDGSGNDTGTVKFKVGDEIKHTVHIHDIPTTKNQDLNQNTGSTTSSISNASYKSARERLGSSSCISDKVDEGPVSAGNDGASESILVYSFCTHGKNIKYFKFINYVCTKP